MARELIPIFVYNEIKEATMQNKFLKWKQSKQQLYNLPYDVKLLRLAKFSECQEQDCHCSRWHSIHVQPMATTFADPCLNCPHTVENHVSHLRPLTEEKINNLMNMVADACHLSVAARREEDSDMKTVCSYFFDVLRRSVLARDEPRVGGILGQPPFEEPTILKAIQNFVVHKFKDLNPQEFRSMNVLTNFFLWCLNNWIYESPSTLTTFDSPDEASIYTINYERWLFFCHVPKICDSLPHYSSTARTFGRTMLRAIFKTTCKQIMDKVHGGKEKYSAETKVLLLDCFPKFLRMLEAEIYAESSLIWDPEFKQVLPAHLQMTLTTKIK